MATYFKDPQSTVAYRKNWTPWLNEGALLVSGETILMDDAGSDLDLGPVNWTPEGVVTYWVSAGAGAPDLSVARVAVRVYADDGSRDDRSDYFTLTEL